MFSATEIMNTELYTLEPDASLQEARDLMANTIFAMFSLLRSSEDWSDWFPSVTCWQPPIPIY